MQNIKEWIRSIQSSEMRQAMPIMTYPGLKLTGKNVLEVINNGKAQFNTIMALAGEFPSAGAVTIMDGNIDPAGIFKAGTPEEIREKTLDLLKKTSKFRNFVLSSGCDVPPGTTIENVEAFYNALEEYNSVECKC